MTNPFTIILRSYGVEAGSSPNGSLVRLVLIQAQAAWTDETYTGTPVEAALTFLARYDGLGSFAMQHLARELNSINERQKRGA